jgi:hypothetical protein|tara:strand:- start:40 stop:789 length:750 start_codon:yes stop_codon:yes gene_type:complete
MIAVFKILCILIDFIKILYNLLFNLKNIRKILGSVKVYKKLKLCKKSDCLVICSGFVTDDWKELPEEYDLFTNSSGTNFLKHIKSDSFVLHYLPPHHSPLSVSEYKKRAIDIKNNHKPSVIICSFVGEDIIYLPAAYRFAQFWPFLRPYNGPAFLLWLGYKLGYKKIYLLGMRGTQMCGAKMYSSGVPELYRTSITYLALSTARMVVEYDKIFNKIQGNGVKIVQLDKDSWLQPNTKDRVVVRIDDSWS